MLVTTLFIININPDDDEAKLGSAALVERNRSKGCRIVQVEVEVLFMGFKDSKVVPNYVVGDATPPKDDNVGVYIVGHGTSDGILGCDGDRLADVFKLLKIPKVRKMCLLACAIAAEKEDTGGKAAKQKRAIEEICEDLGKAGFDPKIAGWDDFVTVCAAGNTSQFTKDEDQVTSPKSNPSNVGKKVMTKGKLLKADLSPKTYKKHKFTCQWIKNAATPIPIGPGVSGWSDKV